MAGDCISDSNLAPRRNGNIIVTTQSAPDLFEIESHGNRTGWLLTTFANEANAFGVVELEQDVFYVGTANYTHAPTWSGVQGSNKIFRVNMTSRTPVVSTVVEISEAYTCDGLTVLNATSGLIMTGDTQPGTLYLIDVTDSSYKPVYHNEQLNETALNASELSHVGLNGLKYYKGYLYFTVTSRGTFGRLPLSTSTGRVSGNFEILYNITLPDDIEVDSDVALLTELKSGVVAVPVNKSSR